MKNIVLGGLIGLSVGDALGVPVEFSSREDLAKKPVTEMRSYGTYNQPEGTWSDDSSMTFCLCESLINGYSAKDLSERFVNWYKNAYWTAGNETFDIGNTTREALENIIYGVKAEEAGLKDEYSNGNGSLMRILPLAFYLKNIEFEKRINIIAEVSSISHGHLRSIIACVIYIDFAINIINGKKLNESYELTKRKVKEYYKNTDEIIYFDGILENDISKFKESEINSSGYVLDTLEASIWCLLNTDNYKDAVLKAVNLGEDTDTTAAVTGGIAGIYYGIETIPEVWLDKLKKEEIKDLSIRLNEIIKTKDDAYHFSFFK